MPPASPARSKNRRGSRGGKGRGSVGGKGRGSVGGKGRGSVSGPPPSRASIASVDETPPAPRNSVVELPRTLAQRQLPTSNLVDAEEEEEEEEETAGDADVDAKAEETKAPLAPEDAPPPAPETDAKDEEAEALRVKKMSLPPGKAPPPIVKAKALPPASPPPPITKKSEEAAPAETAAAPVESAAAPVLPVGAPPPPIVKTEEPEAEAAAPAKSAPAKGAPPPPPAAAKAKKKAAPPPPPPAAAKKSTPSTPPENVSTSQLMDSRRPLLSLAASTLLTTIPFTPRAPPAEPTDYVKTVELADGMCGYFFTPHMPAAPATFDVLRNVHPKEPSGSSLIAYFVQHTAPVFRALDSATGGDVDKLPNTIQEAVSADAQATANLHKDMVLAWVLRRTPHILAFGRDKSTTPTTLMPDLAVDLLQHLKKMPALGRVWLPPTAPMMEKTTARKKPTGPGLASYFLFHSRSIFESGFLGGPGDVFQALDAAFSRERQPGAERYKQAVQAWLADRRAYILAVLVGAADENVVTLWMGDLLAHFKKEKDKDVGFGPPSIFLALLDFTVERQDGKKKGKGDKKSGGSDDDHLLVLRRIEKKLETSEELKETRVLDHVTATRVSRPPRAGKGKGKVRRKAPAATPSA